MHCIDFNIIIQIQSIQIHRIIETGAEKEKKDPLRRDSSFLVHIHDHSPFATHLE